ANRQVTPKPQSSKSVKQQCKIAAQANRQVMPKPQSFKSLKQQCKIAAQANRQVMPKTYLGFGESNSRIRLQQCNLGAI
ncbi:MAG: hypothetical protein WA435_02825, partial [Gallionellaceae bacterium]